MLTVRKVAMLVAVSSALLIAPTYAAETAGEYIDDATLATKTKTALLSEDAATAIDINVEVYKGVVQLSGFVDSDAEKSAALATAAKIEGAREVLDAIIVMPGSRSMGETVDDTTIQAKLKSTLAQVEGLANAVAINTGVRQGHVLLAGFVDSESVKSAAGNAAEGIEGVKEVHNLIAVQP